MTRKKFCKYPGCNRWITSRRLKRGFIGCWKHSKMHEGHIHRYVTDHYLMCGDCKKPIRKLGAGEKEYLEKDLPKIEFEARIARTLSNAKEMLKNGTVV